MSEAYNNLLKKFDQAIQKKEADNFSKDDVKEIYAVASVLFDGSVYLEQKQLEQIRDKWVALAAGTYLARDLVNLPPNICNPAYMAQRAQTMAEETGLKFEALEEQQMRQQCPSLTRFPTGVRLHRQSEGDGCVRAASGWRLQTTARQGLLK